MRFNKCVFVEEIQTKTGYLSQVFSPEIGLIKIFGRKAFGLNFGDAVDVKVNLPRNTTFFAEEECVEEECK